MTIQMIILDVDGCLTDGRIVYGESGEEIKAFNVKDGLAIKSWQNLGYHAAIITGRSSQIVARRAKELGITHLHQGEKDKKSRLLALCDTLGITPQECAAIGDDLNDLRMLMTVGRSFAPADAVRPIADRVDHVLARRGGDACVREMIERLIRDNGDEARFLAPWE